jgi:hypothetical protein
MSKGTSWHQTVKEVLKELGKKKNYDVSESEQEILLASRFKRFTGEKRQIHELVYKPDIVWKKGHIRQAIFEIEYLNPTSEAQLMEKRKYSIGSLMLAYLAIHQKSIQNLIFVTNSEALCTEIAKFVQLLDSGETNYIWYISEPSLKKSTITRSLEETILKDWKI